ncbi:MAG: hypothetical protein ABII64_08095 [Elusimicrobiota bacterium]
MKKIIIAVMTLVFLTAGIVMSEENTEAPVTPDVSVAPACPEDAPAKQEVKKKTKKKKVTKKKVTKKKVKKSKKTAKPEIPEEPETPEAK